MKLKIKETRFDSEDSAVLIREEVAAALDLHIGDRVILSHNGYVTASPINVTKSLIEKEEISLSKETMEHLKVKPHEYLDVSPMSHPKSLGFILKKLNGGVLSKKEIYSIIKNIVDNVLTEAEIAYFVSGVYENGMSLRETIYLTEAIYKTGEVLTWPDKKIADKHSIGGIAGNRTTPIVVSICAAAGITIPKTSSRAITSAAGTADVMEVITKVEFSAEELKKIVKKTGACLAWGGALGFAPADDKLIRVERLLNIDPESQLIASILAKKLAVGSKYVLIDIPYGRHAKVTREKAEKLKKKFLAIGRYFGLKINVLLTDGSQPIGNGVGPVLEMLDILKVLKRENPPSDLKKKSVLLAGTLLEITGKAKKGKGEQMALEIIDSGEALKKFNEIISAQGRKHGNLRPAKYKQHIKAEKTGKIKSINNSLINQLAKLLGCPIDKSAGIYLYKHNFDKVVKGENLMTFYSESKSKLGEAIDFYTSTIPIRYN